LNLRPLGHEEGERCLHGRAVSRSCTSATCCLSPVSRLEARVDVVPRGLVSKCVSKRDDGDGGPKVRRAIGLGTGGGRAVDQAGVTPKIPVTPKRSVSIPYAGAQSARASDWMTADAEATRGQATQTATHAESRSPREIRGGR